MVNFKEFLLNENKIRLGKRVGDVLNSVHELQDDMENISVRHLKKVAENIVNQIRRILHSQWGTEDHKYLKRLQSVGVAIMKALEEKGDIKEILSQVGSELESLSKKLGVKINQLEPPADKGQEAPMDLTANQDKDMSKKPQQAPQAPPQGDPMGMPPQGMGMPPQGMGIPQQPPQDPMGGLPPI